MRRRISRVQSDGAFEIVDRFGHLLRVERVEPNPSLGERLVGIQAARLAKRTSRRRIVAGCRWPPKLRDDAVLEVEDVGEQSVGLAVGECLAAAASTARAVMRSDLPRSLEAPDHRHVELQLASQGRQVVPERLAAWTMRVRSRILTCSAARRSLVTVSAMPDDSQSSDVSRVTFVKSSTPTEGSSSARVRSSWPPSQRSAPLDPAR